MWRKIAKYGCMITFFGGLLAASLFYVGISAMEDKYEPGPEEVDNNDDKAPVVLMEGWDNYLSSCQVAGSITIYDLSAGQWYTSDTADMKVRTLPASTFKILNTLILLKEGAVASEKDSIYWPVAYDTAKYGHRPDIYHSMPLEEAFRKSAGWAYIELAKKVGKETYAQYLERLGYGNGDLSVEGMDFWNYGPFGVSPEEQVMAVMGIYHRSFPFSEAHYDILEDMMVVEENEAYTLRAKTGWTRAGGTDTGWWVGYLKKTDNTWFFATRITKDRETPNPDFGACRKEITRQVLKELDAL
ncbi:penicillin-binding transpeptidase domain-containing protein [Roseivirga sp. BDSF3-8]|uniref:penicillin-binding transpeptidase domain-containing protein n=1 Tax=Roseivirga sp. BDSF3-8 TaxID=3241598 RepID=UPI003531D3D0